LCCPPPAFSFGIRDFEFIRGQGPADIHGAQADLPHPLSPGSGADVVSEEYEEINSEEVDRVVAALELLSESVSSETIKSMLDGVSSEIYYLVYEDEEGLAA
jgi:hypothetical protein